CFTFVIHVRQSRVNHYLVARLIQHPGAFHPRPRPDTEIGTPDFAERDQTIERCINPTVHWHVGRAHAHRLVPRFRLLIPWVSPCTSTEMRIMMCAIHLASEVPAQQTSNYRIRREVLLACHACHGHS